MENIKRYNYYEDEIRPCENCNCTRHLLKLVGERNCGTCGTSIIICQNCLTKKINTFKEEKCV